MKVTVYDMLLAWNNCQISTNALLNKCQDFSMRLCDVIQEHEKGRVSLVDIFQTYTECHQAHGLLDAAKRLGGWRGCNMLVSTLWPQRRQCPVIQVDLGELTRVGRAIFERDGFEAMQHWMEGEFFPVK
jgi:hypothetical protein